MNPDLALLNHNIMYEAPGSGNQLDYSTETVWTRNKITTCEPV